jgi:hypothetical protein
MLTWPAVVAKRPTFRVGDGVRFGVHTAFGQPIQTPALFVGLPFSTAGCSPCGVP